MVSDRMHLLFWCMKSPASCMKMRTAATADMEPMMLFGETETVFWPRRIALEMNAHVILNPGLDIQPWFEEQISHRAQYLLTPCVN